MADKNKIKESKRNDNSRSGRRVNKFPCNILRYIEKNRDDKEFIDLIDDKCMRGMFKPRGRNKFGVTLLYPVSGSSYREKLFTNAYSDKIDDHEESRKMLNRIVLRDKFKSIDEWKRKQDDVPNMANKHTPIDKITDSAVYFKGGGYATLDTNFRDESQHKNLAVWNLHGDLPESTKDATFKHIREQKQKFSKRKKPTRAPISRSKALKTGSYEITPSMSQSLRLKIAIAVENAYVLNKLSGEKRDAFCEYTLNFANYMMINHKEIFFQRVLPLISFDKIDFYFLIEPHKYTDDHLIDEEIIQNWWSNKDLHSFDMDTVKKQIQHCLDNPIDSCKNVMIYNNRTKLIDEIDKLRADITELFTNGNFPPALDAVSKHYTSLETSNKIGDCENVLPSDLFEYYQHEEGLKLIQDELRYLAYLEFKELEKPKQFNINRYNYLLNIIGEFLFADSIEERAKQSKLLNKKIIRYSIQPKEKIENATIFINSTMFLQIPLTENDAKNYPILNSTSRPNLNEDDDELKVFNIALNQFNSHNRLLQIKKNGLDIIELLKSMNINKLDPSVKDELKKKLM